MAKKTVKKTAGKAVAVAAPVEKAVVVIKPAQLPTPIQMFSLRERTEAGLALRKKYAAQRAAFVLPKSMSAQVEKLSELGDARTGNEVQLSALLHQLTRDDNKEAAAFLATLRDDQGRPYSDVRDLADRRYNISGSRARMMILNWDMFKNLGLTETSLTGPEGVNFVKFKELKPLYDAGVIKNEKTLTPWLPHVSRRHEMTMTIGQLEKVVREELTKARTENRTNETAERAAKFACIMQTSTLSAFREMLNGYKTAIGVEGDGDAMFQALQSAVVERLRLAPGADKTLNMLGLVNAVAATAPVIPVCIPTASDAAYSDLGVPLARQVYATFEGGETRMCLSASVEAAAEHLGVSPDAVKAFDVSVADDLKPVMSYSKEMLEKDLVDGGADPQAAKEETGARFTFTGADDVDLLVRYGDGDDPDRFGVILKVVEKSSMLKILPTDSNGVPVENAKAVMVSFAAVREHFARRAKNSETPKATEPAAPKVKRTRKKAAAPEAQTPTTETVPVTKTEESSATETTTEPEVTFDDLLQETRMTAVPDFPLTSLNDMSAEIRRVAGLLSAAGHPDVSAEVPKKHGMLRNAYNSDGQPNPYGRALRDMLVWIYEQADRHNAWVGSPTSLGG